MTSLTSFMMNANFACYDKCNTVNDLTFMSIKEGKCYRNCISKLNYYMPTIRPAIEGTAYEMLSFENNMLRAKLGRPNPNLSLLQ